MPLALPDLRIAGETHNAYAARIKSLEREVRALLYAAQRDRKEVPLCLDAAEVGKLRPRW